MSLLQKINEAKHIGRGTYNTKLLVTSEMIRQARGNKFSFIATMRPEDFLKLTTSGNHPPEYFKEKCRNIDDYNKWAKEGETIIMPGLWIKGDTVVGHEGRHRAAATICAGGNAMPVAVRLYPQEEHEEKYGYWDAPYDMKFEDMPDAIHGEYGTGIVLKSDFNVIHDGWRTLQQHAEQLTEARHISRNVAEIADLYDEWKREVNPQDDIWVIDAGFNQFHKPPVAYMNIKVEATTQDAAVEKTKEYLNHATKHRIPYTEIKSMGQLESQSFFDEKDTWFVSVIHM